MFSFVTSEAEHEVKIAKKAMKSKEDLDNKGKIYFSSNYFYGFLFIAVKVAGKMQRAVTEKRGEIDSLQSKIRWLEDSLEVSKKVCTN
jgi:hypothetical protein